MTVSPRRGTGILLAFLVAAAIQPLSPRPLAGQSFRGTARTSARYVQIRPLVRDTVDRSQVTEESDGTLSFQGHPVDCPEAGPCSFLHSPETEGAVAVTQDVHLTGWGFGVRGLSATVHVRGRQDVGGGFLWPRSDDPVDLVTGYVQLNRGPVRVRAGRQRSRSGLGFASYDGASLLLEPEPELWIEAYGGRSLARGLHEPRHEALEGIESFLKDRDAYLLGAAAGVEAIPLTFVVARYRREIWSNRAALVSERASLDLDSRLLRPVRLSGSLDYDFAFGRIGKARLAAELPVPSLDATVEASFRRYVPYFELWTIWGLFSPVAYHGGSLRATWSSGSSLGLWAEGGFRTYGDVGFHPLGGPVDDDAWRAAVGGRLVASPSLRVTGGYRIEWGAGAFLSSGRFSARWEPRDRYSVTAHALLAQQIEEFRVGEGVVAGGGLEPRVRLGRRLELAGGIALYRRLFENRPEAVDWNQLRAWTALRVALGSDPGAVEGDR